MSVSCEPKDLIAAARCYSCFPPQQLQSLKTRIRCEWAKESEVPPVPPPIPTGLALLNTSTAVSVRLTWTGLVPNPTTYELFLSINGGPYAFRVSVPGASVNYIDAGPVGLGEVWRYEIRACNIACSGLSGPTNAIDRDRTDLATVNILYNDLLVMAGTDTFGPSAAHLTFSAPILYWIRGDVLFGGSNAMLTINLAALNFIVGILDCNFCTSLTAITLTNLITAGSLDFEGTPALLAFNVPALTTVTQYATFADTAAASSLASITAPVLTQVGTDCLIRFTAASVLAAMNLNSLATVGGLLEVTGSILNPVTFPALVTVNQLLLSNNNQALSADFANLTTLGADIDIQNNALLAAVNFPMLGNVGGNVVIANNASLTAIDFGGMVVPDGITINLSGNALDNATFGPLLANLVGLGGYVALTVDLSGGANEGYAAWPVAVQNDYDTLALAGNIMNSNP